MGFTGSSWVLLGYNGFYWVFTGFHRNDVGSDGFDLMKSFTKSGSGEPDRPYKVLKGKLLQRLENGVARK